MILDFNKGAAVAGGLCLLALSSPAQSTRKQRAETLNPVSHQSVLVPRMPARERNELLHPLTGTMVFQTDSTQGFYYYTGAHWLSLTQQNLVPPVQPAAQVTTVAGHPPTGLANDPTALFHNPYGVAAGPDGTLYVADTYNHRISKISLDGTISTLAGSTQGYQDGRAARFDTPTGVAVDAQGQVFVADAGNNQIRRIAPDGSVTTLAGRLQGYLNGRGTEASFHNPYGVAVGPDGTLYVTDASNNRICHITATGVKTLASGSFDRPMGLAVDATGTVYVADSNNNRICRILANGTVSTLAGSREPGYANGPGNVALFNHPSSVAVDQAGNVYVGEQGSHRLRRISPSGVVSTLAGSGTAAFADGGGEQAAFSLPAGVAIDQQGTLYVADTGNDCIRRVLPVP